MAFNLGFQTKHILSPWSMLFHHMKVSLKVFSILFKVHSARCALQSMMWSFPFGNWNVICRWSPLWLAHFTNVNLLPHLQSFISKRNLTSESKSVFFTAFAIKSFLSFSVLFNPDHSSLVLYNPNQVILVKMILYTLKILVFLRCFGSLIFDHLLLLFWKSFSQK